MAPSTHPDVLPPSNHTYQARPGESELDRDRIPSILLSLDLIFRSPATIESARTHIAVYFGFSGRIIQAKQKSRSLQELTSNSQLPTKSSNSTRGTPPKLSGIVTASLPFIFCGLPCPLNNHPFDDVLNTGNVTFPKVEFAPYQKVAGPPKKIDSRIGTIDTGSHQYPPNVFY
jgi:hypothetical protein